MFKGKMQYPRTQTDSKNEIFPPSRATLIVTTAAPSQTMTNTTEKIKALSSSDVDPALIDIDRPKQNTSGPHKSHFLKSAEVVPVGIRTCFKRIPIALISRKTVSLTGSSRVVSKLSRIVPSIILE